MKNLLEAKLLLGYYKGDITNRYQIIKDNICLDDDILKTTDMLYITTLKKHQEYKDTIKKLKKRIEELENE